MSEKADIDFVILWVDDQDPIWIEDKNKYKGQQIKKNIKHIWVR